VRGFRIARGELMAFKKKTMSFPTEDGGGAYPASFALLHDFFR
jgi:hypothetical protein